MEGNSQPVLTESAARLKAAVSQQILRYPRSMVASIGAYLSKTFARISKGNRNPLRILSVKEVEGLV